jgi:hypothetical protein
VPTLGRVKRNHLAIGLFRRLLEDLGEKFWVAPGPDRNAALLGSAPVLSAAISCALYLLGAGAFVGQTRRWRVAALTTIPHSGYLLVDTFSLLGGTFGSTFG